MTPRRPCRRCGKNRAERFFKGTRGTVCSDCRKRRTSSASRAGRLMRLYRMTLEMYERLFRHQKEVCGGCGERRTYRLHVDHDHSPLTPYVRGLLCARCNKVLRDVRDNSDTLLQLAYYLKNPPAYEVLGYHRVGDAHVRSG